MSKIDQNTLSDSYNAVADEYTQRIFYELDRKPFDRELLERFANNIQNDQTVADIGCGPGHVGRYLHDQGVNVCGVDISSKMIESARNLNPDLEFMHGDMQSLPVDDHIWGGIVAFYSIIHIPSEQIVDTLKELDRVLEPGAPLLLAFHIGDEIVHLDDWWEQNVSLDFYFFQTDEMKNWLMDAGFVIEEGLEREPYAEDIEHQSRRGYIIARKPKQQEIR